mgnify:FL=1
MEKRIVVSGVDEIFAAQILVFCKSLTPDQFKDFMDMLNEFYMLTLENKDEVIQ